MNIFYVVPSEAGIQKTLNFLASGLYLPLAGSSRPAGLVRNYGIL